MCEFCSEFRRSEGAGTRIVWRDENWVVIPTLGCFVPGYALLLPVDHHLSFGSLPAAERAAAESVVERLRASIAADLGPTVVAEHGATHCNAGSQCCDHAHLHVIPVPDPDAVVRRYSELAGEPIRLQALEDLRVLASEPYMYLSPRPEVHLAWPNGHFPSQFVRRVCAEQHGVADRFDWRRYRFEQSMWETRSLLASRFQDERNDPRAEDPASIAA